MVLSARDRLRRLFGGGADENYALAAQAIGYATQTPQAHWPSWDPAIAAKTGYSRLALIYRCVNITAYFVGTAPLRVYTEREGGKQYDNNHDLRRLMQRPNPIMGETSYWSHVAVRSAISGFCVSEKERDTDGNVIGLWPLQSTWLKCIKRSDGRSDWEYRIPRVSEVFRLKAEDVVVHTWADTPSGSPTGMGPLEACFREIAVSNTMVDFLKVFFENGAVPLTGLVLDTMPGQTLPQSRVDELTDRFVQRHAGLRNAAMPIPLTGVKDIKRLGFDFNELAYTDLRDLSELAIIQAFGIPASVAQIRVGLEHSDSRANAEVDEMKFYRQTIIPWWTRQDDVITLQLLPDFDSRADIGVEFDTRDISALQDDQDALTTRAINVLNATMVTLNESRAMIDLPSLGPVGDVFKVPFNATFAKANELAGVTSGNALFAALAPREAHTEGTEQHVPILIAHANGELDDAGLAMQLSAGRINRATERLAKASDEKRNIVKVADRHAPAIQQYFLDQADRLIPKIMEGLSATRGPDETYDLGNIDWKHETGLLTRVLKSLWTAAGKTSFAAVRKQYGLDIGMDFNLSHPKVKATIDKLGKRVVDITETTRGIIKDVLAEAADKGLTSDETAKALQSKWKDLARPRANVIARTESMVSYGEANHLAFKESGVVDRAQIFDNETHTDDYGAPDGLTCATRDGIIVPLAKAMDHIYADHPNGSAVMTPVLEGED